MSSKRKTESESSRWDRHLPLTKISLEVRTPALIQTRFNSMKMECKAPNLQAKAKHSILELTEAFLVPTLTLVRNNGPVLEESWEHHHRHTAQVVIKAGMV